MFGSVSGLSNPAYTWLNTQNVQKTPPTSSVPVQSDNTTLPVQPVPAAREVIPNDAKFSIETLLNQHASDPVGMAARMRIQYPGAQNEQAALSLEDAKSAQEVFEEAECQTCANRKYIDGSDDPGVSFKTATHISPDQASSAVRGHEYEHVVRNQAKAAREGREVVSQSVIIHTAICPECGRAYTSGGTTRTVTSGPANGEIPQSDPQRTPFSAVA